VGVVLAGAIALAAALCASASQAASPIFKCRDSRGAVVYTDVECTDGAKLDLRPGDADPLAIERLARRQQAASEQFARDRAAAEIEAAERRARTPPFEYAPPQQPVEYGGWYGYGFGYGYVPDRVRPRDPPRREFRRDFSRGRDYHVPAAPPRSRR
jgi:hypothetical protein